MVKIGSPTKKKKKKKNTLSRNRPPNKRAEPREAVRLCLLLA